MSCRWPVLAFCAALAALSPNGAKARHRLLQAPGQPPDPTDQPPSRGQDELACGALLFPDDVFLAPKVQDGFAKSGDIESGDGAIHASWQQDLFAWDYQTVYFYSTYTASMLNWHPLSVKAEVITNPEFQCPGTKITMMTGLTTIVLKDCEGVVLYIIRESQKPPFTIDIYNRAEVLVAQSVTGNVFKEQIHFYDHENKPLAIAQSPQVIEGVPNPGLFAAFPRGVIPTWEVRFLSGYDSQSPLLLPDSRWVIILAVQELAIRTAQRGPDGAIMEPLTYYIFLALALGALGLFIASLIGVFVYVYRLATSDLSPEEMNPITKKRGFYSALKAWWMGREPEDSNALQIWWDGFDRSKVKVPHENVFLRAPEVPLPPAAVAEGDLPFAGGGRLGVPEEGQLFPVAGGGAWEPGHAIVPPPSQTARLEFRGLPWESGPEGRLKSARADVPLYGTLGVPDAKLVGVRNVSAASQSSGYRRS